MSILPLLPLPAVLLLAVTAHAQVCLADLSGYAIDIPLFGGFGCEGTFEETKEENGNCEHGCTFGFKVHIEFTMPYAADLSSGFVLCWAATGVGPACAPTVVTDHSGANPPPYVYHFDYATDNFQLACDTWVLLELYWNPGSGNIKVAEADMICGGCAY